MRRQYLGVLILGLVLMSLVLPGAHRALNPHPGTPGRRPIFVFVPVRGEEMPEWVSHYRGLLSEAQTALAEVRDPQVRGELLSQVGIQQAVLDVEAGIALLREIPDRSTRALAWAKLAGLLYEDLPRKARRLWDEALSLGEKVTSPPARALLLVSVGHSAAKWEPLRARRSLQAAEEIAQSLTDPEEQATVGLALVEGWAPLSREKSEQAAQKVRAAIANLPRDRQASVLGLLAAALGPVDVRAAREVAGAIPDPVVRIRTLCKLAELVRPEEY